jgi:hypothetical protein
MRAVDLCHLRMRVRHPLSAAVGRGPGNGGGLAKTAQGSRRAGKGWYIGEMAAIQYQTGHNPFSFTTLGGRAAGGFAAGSVGAATMIALKNPFASGAAAGGVGYTVDRGTQ